MDTPKWNRDSILRWILERDSQGEPIRAKDALAYNSYMYREAMRSFGSWTGALAAAGINLPARQGARTWSPKKVIRGIQRASVKPESLCYKNMMVRRRSLLEAAKKHFGSWRKALIAAGVDPESVRLTRTWDRESVIEAILDRAVKDEPLAVTKVSPSSLAQWGIRIFGSWGEALRTAGLAPDQYVYVRVPGLATDSGTLTEVGEATAPPQKWSKDRITEELRRRVQEGKAINMARLKIEDRPLHSAVRRHFGSWELAVLHADLDPGRYRGRRTSRSGRGRCADQTAATSDPERMP